MKGKKSSIEIPVQWVGFNFLSSSQMCFKSVGEDFNQILQDLFITLLYGRRMFIAWQPEALGGAG